MSEQYFSPALQNKLSQISASSLTMIEAPAGYGKTTAVKHFAESFPKTEVRWYTSVESTPGRSAEWFFDQVEELDAASGKALKDLGFINRSNAAKAASILYSMRISTDCCLIFDNFQFAMPNWQVPILLSLAYRKPDRLRIVLISQNFGKLRAAMENASNVCLITSRDLLLSADDIAAYGRQLGAGIDKKQAERIGDYTEGWVAAVSLYLKNIKPSERQSCFSGTSIR